VVRTIAALLMVLVAAGSASADTVLTRKAQSVRHVKIVEFDRARLTVMDSQSGQRSQIDFADVYLVRVDGRAELNEAEKLLSLKKYDEAVAAYREALGFAGGGWEGAWVRVRLVNLLARGGKLDEAAELIVRLAEDIPEWLIQVLPTRGEIPSDEKAMGAATATLVAARNKAGSAETRQALSRVLERLGINQPNLADRKKVVREVTESELLNFRRPGAWLDQWAAEQLEAGKADQLLATTETLFAAAVRADLPGILHWRGRGLSAAGRFDGAALELLRVAVEFPQSPYAAGSLFYAAEALDQGSRQVFAKAVREELVRRFGDSTEAAVAEMVDGARRTSGNNEK